jgi:hypothetical protein
MSNIRENSPQVENNPPANNTTIPEVAQTPKSIFESCQKNETKPHGFSKTVAEMKKGKQKLGWSAALVLKYLCYMLRKQGQHYEDKKWVRINLDHIASQYPHLGRTGVDGAIQRLKTFEACEAKNLNREFNRPGYDRTRWYSVPRRWMNAAERELRYFYAPLAAVIGVPAAVLHYNFTHWIDEQSGDGKQGIVTLVPSVLSRLQPFSEKTIDRALAVLKGAGLIHPVPGKTCCYSQKPIENSGSKLDALGSKVDMAGSKVDTGGSKVDNNSYCSSFVDILEECSKIQPTADSHKQVPSVGNQHRESAHKVIGLEQVEFLSPLETVIADDQDTGSAKHEPNQVSSAFPPQESLSSYKTPLSLSAGGEDNELPAIHDYAELHKENFNNRGMVSALTNDKKTKNLIVQKAFELAYTFFHKSGHDFVDQLYDKATDEELFEALFPLYRNWFPLRCDETLQDILYYGVFECVLNAFFYGRREHQKVSHPFVDFIAIGYECHLKMRMRAYARQEKAIEQENDELRTQFASVDEGKEWDGSLSPAEKARIFRNALNARNQVGWICLGGERKTDQIKTSKASLREVEKLFNLNPAASAGDLLMVMDACMKIHSTFPPVSKIFRPGIKWHARHGRKLSTFVRDLKTIMKQVELLNELPLQRFLNENIEDEALLQQGTEQCEGKAA